MGRRKNSGKIVPFEKKAPAESIDKIPETASLDDYEKVISKLANSSNDIIDGALDKLDGNSATQLQTTKNTICVSEPEPVSEPTEDKPSKDDFPVSETPTAKEQFSQDIPAVRRDNHLAREIELLKKSLSDAAKDLSKKEREVDALTEKNDNLILKNSELEFEISRLTAENNKLKQDMERMANQLRLPPQTYSRNGYTNPPQSAMNQVRKLGRTTQPRRPVMSMNGYESWN